MAFNLRALFRQVKDRIRKAPPAKRAALVAGIVVAAPVWVPLVVLNTGLKWARKHGILAPGESFAQARKVDPPRIDEDQEARLAERPDDFALIRIIGNDLPPRHKSGQSLENLQYVLEHEAEFANCTKLWLVNRIRDAGQEARILEALEAAGQTYRHLQFDLDAYAQAPLDFSLMPEPQFIHSKTFDEMNEGMQDRAIASTYRRKNAYAMHNNGARNTALEWGLDHAKWVMPWDGNCFVTEADWARIVGDVARNGRTKYFTVPMVRMTSNDDAAEEMDPKAASEEPQVIFRRDSTERFDERFPYGRRPKVEFLVRLGILGSWSTARRDPWDQPANPVVADSHRVGTAGMVRRLASGRPDLETGKTGLRVAARDQAIVTSLREIDKKVLQARGFDRARPLFFDVDALSALGGAPTSGLAEGLRAKADAALTRGPFSVRDKTERPPSGEAADYYHPAPYWWPNPKSKTGLPYVRIDGKRLPGTVLYAPESAAYDRTRLQDMVDDTVACGLAWASFGTEAHRDHAARLIRTWFLDETTAMAPHLRYAQVKRGHGNDEGGRHGIIEFKDLAYLLDAVRLLGDTELSDALADWLRQYRDWLLTSPQGTGERRATNNHGVFFDLQLAAIAAFLGDLDLLLDCHFASVARVSGHFADDGTQPHEMRRSLTQHYTAFNLHGWLSLCKLYRSCGFDLSHQPEFSEVVRGAQWVLAQRQGAWPHEQVEPFDADRYAAIALFADATLSSSLAKPEDRDVAMAKPLFHPHDGVPPFWSLMVLPQA